MFVIGIILGILLSIATTVVMWKNSHLFLSRRDYYVNSKYNLFKKRISMSLSAGSVVLLIFILLARGMSNQNRQQHIKLNSSDTLTDKSVKKKANKHNKGK